MKERLLITTAIGLMLGTGAFAQSSSDKSKTDPPPAAQSQTNQNSSTSPAPSSTSSQSSAPSAQNAPSTSSDKSSTSTSQSTPSTGDTSSQAQSNQPSPPSQGQSTNKRSTGSFQQRRDGSFAGSIYPAAERALSGTDQHGAADQQSDPDGANRLQHEYQCGDSAVDQYQYRGSAVEHPILRSRVHPMSASRPLSMRPSAPASRNRLQG